jgi:hypothetical protein
MFPLFIYTAVAALVVVAAQAIQPSEALRSDHHRKLYWTGAFTSIGLISLVGAVLVG